MTDLRKVSLNDIPPDISSLKVENSNLKTANTKLEKENKVLKKVLLGLTLLGGVLSIIIPSFISKNYIRVKKKEK